MTLFILLDILLDAFVLREVLLEVGLRRKRSFSEDCGLIIIILIWNLELGIRTPNDLREVESLLCE